MVRGGGTTLADLPIMETLVHSVLPGTTRVILRLEAAAVFALALAAYPQWTTHGWVLFVSLFLVPDLPMLAYLRNPRLGAWAYNLAHSYVGPALLGVVAWRTSGDSTRAIALIWAAHIGFDRMLGYGLKFDTAFDWTHLGPIGKAKRALA
jgi:hypothetical protein